MRGYASILLLILVAVALPIIIWNLSWLLRPSWPSAAKYSSYECGIVAAGEAREKFSVFDVETVFLMPWAIQMKELALFGAIELGLFLFLLLFGYGYIWSKGALTWE
jgi:NADH-quinone oxidoreductase subunit A